MRQNSRFPGATALGVAVKTNAAALLLPLGMLVAACNSSPTGLSGGNSDGVGGGESEDVGAGAGGTVEITTTGSNGTGGAPAKTALDDRVTDYNEAFRTASIKLVQALPTLEQTNALASAKDKKAAYTTAIDALLADPRFNASMVKFWQDAMRIGGDDNMDSAPVLAAKTMAEGKPYSTLFTASAGACPTFDPKTNTFAEGECMNTAPAQAGVLSNPGVMKQFFSNLGFRRVRWVQETFVCTKFPAEVVTKPTKIDGKDYTSPWDFKSVATAPINFQDTSSVVCADCHTTINHLAPLFGNFDMNGKYQDQISVVTPVVPTPTPTIFSDWLQDGEKTSWRHGEETPDLPSLGKAMAVDPDVAACAVARMWDFTMSKEDIVNDLATVPASVVKPYATVFAKNQDLKATLRAMLLSDDFTSF